MKASFWVWLRRISQTFFLLLFLFLLVESRLPPDVYHAPSPGAPSNGDIRLEEPATFFFQLDPLIGVSSLLAGHAMVKGFFWGLGLLVVTLFLGRIFCGFICPLGTLHHVISWVRPALRGDRMVKANAKTPGQRIKYFVLIAILVGALSGLNLAGLMDPIALLFRSVALAVLPALGGAVTSLQENVGHTDLRIMIELGRHVEEWVSPVFGYERQYYQAGWFIGLFFLTTLFLNRIRPRFWCRTLCPLGALLGLCSRFSLLKLEKSPEKCTGCKACTKSCQGAASPVPGEAWETAECMVCFNCYGTCPEGALTFSIRWHPRRNKAPDMGRRAVLGGLLAGVCLPLLAGTDRQMHGVSGAGLIRPPGSLPEKDFLALCQRCGLCMKVCPTSAINPTFMEAGAAGLWTPHLVMIQGYCEYTCTLCGSVCPTGAIREVSGKEKIEHPIRIGSAYVDRGRCLPWSGNGPCIVCQEHCPTSPKAIYLKKERVLSPDGRDMEVQLPFVNLKQCVGCGICENKCPVRGKPAISVISAGESRSPQNQIIL